MSDGNTLTESAVY